MMGAPQPAAAAKMPEPVRIAAPDDPDLMEARRKKMAEEFRNREGRSSTQLSGDTQRAYARAKLGET